MGKHSFGFIGTGNMGGALVRAACRRLVPQSVCVSDHFREKARQLADELGCACGDNLSIARDSFFIFLGVKPQMMAEMLEEIAPALRQRTDRFVLVSMAAGLSIDQLRVMAGGEYPIIRIMPNMPASVGHGMILYAPSEDVTADEVAAMKDGLSRAGEFDLLSERLIDAGSSVCGCGPAFFYMFIEALSDGGVAAGLTRAQAMKYAAQAALGAGHMVIESGMHPGELKDAVCSPGGSTIMGVKALEDGGLRAAAFNAVLSACAKSKELGK